jgi:hypothetical protein
MKLQQPKMKLQQQQLQPMIKLVLLELPTTTPAKEVTNKIQLQTTSTISKNETTTTTIATTVTSTTNTTSDKIALPRSTTAPTKAITTKNTITTKITNTETIYATVSTMCNRYLWTSLIWQW